MNMSDLQQGPCCRLLKKQGRHTPIGQVAFFETVLGEQFHLDREGNILDQEGRSIGTVRCEQQLIRFEINRSASSRRRRNKLAGVIRNGEALISTRFNAIPATVSIGRFKDFQGQLLTVQALLHLLSYA